LKVVDRGHQHRPFVLNQNRAQVPALVFLDPRFNAVSAIWALDLNGGSAIGNSEPSAVVHNPNALNPVPIGFLPADCEYAAIPKGDELVLSKVSASAASDG
jgi:type I restriction enzyme S subunit